jgi:FkbM family methyltransferase
MKKILINIICGFIPSKRIRRQLRRKDENSVDFYHSKLQKIYQKIGIMNGSLLKKNGEDFFLKKVLNKYIKINNPIFFDVGANIGNYSVELKTYFPNSTIYSFEPSEKAYKEFFNKKIQNINVYNVGIGEKDGKLAYYNYKSDVGSEHGSLYKEVFTNIHNSNNIVKKEVKIITLDDFCNKNKLKKINFLKIDTEGSELNVLKGSKKLIKENKIDIIQFEFNVMNIVSRTFMNDYYEILGDNYDFYRLLPKGMLKLGKYSPFLEIFYIQNIIAVNKKINKNLKC